MISEIGGSRESLVFLKTKRKGSVSRKINVLNSIECC